ncbi:MAG: hypothetical protein ACRDSP_01845 [Pseudonocardiaceae bacterium]
MNITRSAPERATTSTRTHPCPVVPITDARTGGAHLVTDEAIAAGRRAGRYVTVCGIVALAGSPTAEADTFCLSCREWARR